MKITLFTANQSRHNYLINLLSGISEELNVIQENDTLFPGNVEGHYPASGIYKDYFNNVVKAQKILFGENYINAHNLNLLSMKEGDINKCSKDTLKKFLESDIYIVTGSSFIKGELAKFLVKNNALSIHMGLAPYYRGTDCNFWALYDNNPHLVGATIYMLSEGLDTGKILYHALTEIKDDPFLYTMSTVKSAFDSLAERIANKTIFKMPTVIQDKGKEVRYSKKNEFTEEIIHNFYKKKIELNKFTFNNSLYVNPFILKNK
tara:strand:+ start:492 stop:1277 length:786 start_codon:yes stop_codon:yes gene_type:complete